MADVDEWGTCNPGWYPEDAPVELPVELGPRTIWDPTELVCWDYSTELRVSRSGRLVGSVSTGGLALDLRSPVTLDASIRGPNVYLRQGDTRSPYLFGTDPELEEGFAENGNNRYYVDGFVAAGGDINNGSNPFAVRGYRAIPYLGRFKTSAKFAYFSAKVLGVSMVKPLIFRDTSCINHLVHEVVEN